MLSRRMQRVKLLLSIFLLSLSLVPNSVPAEEAAPSVTAKGAILIEASSGRILYEKNADGLFEPASTTKIMTAIVAIESGDSNQIVRVSEKAANTEGSSIYLSSGESISLEDLLYGLMLQSGNDAAVAIAEAVGGSVEAFVRMMNDKAALLGLKHTHFENPNGLHVEGHNTTARELCAIASYAMQNERFRTIVSTKTWVAKSSFVPRTFQNKNKFLSTYEGYNGVKTGYTKAAGKCLVFSAKRDEMQLIGVVLKASDMWNDAKTLLDYGFDTYEMCPVATINDHFSVNVRNGAKKSLRASPIQDILYPVRSDGTETLSVSKSCVQMVTAPVAKEQRLGTIRVVLNGETLFEIPIVADDEVSQKRYSDSLMELIRSW